MKSQRPTRHAIARTTLSRLKAPAAKTADPARQRRAQARPQDGADPMGAQGWEHIFIWIGCVEAGERACELAIELHRVSGAQVTLGVPMEAGLHDLQRLAAPLSESGIDVRVRVLPDRSISTLLDTMHCGGHDLILHADREGKLTPGPRLLRRLCSCPVWVLRSPQQATNAAA